MKVKICNLLRVTTYLELLLACFIIAVFAYNTYLQVNANFEILSFLLVVGAVLQATYTIAVVRLMLYYAPGHKIPDNSFLRFYNSLVTLNMVVVVGLTVYFTIHLIGFIRQMQQPILPHPRELLQVCIIGSYSVVSAYTIAGAAKLKKAILQRQDWFVENWLMEIGQHRHTSNYSTL